MSNIDDLLAANATYASTFDQADLATAPKRKLTVVTCMDSRLDVFAMLGLELGEAHIVRNAGGVVTDDVIRSLIISQRTLGTEEIVLVHHTRCGLLGFRDDAIKDEIEAETGIRPSFAMEAFTDVEQDVRQSMGRIRTSPLVKHKQVRGFVYDVDTGRITEVQ
ncbi:MAG: carbonic anhydrase [Acidimicrobiales bacterium]|nr:carbonic anhydrase [Acidimicrobiales bacterium]